MTKFKGESNEINLFYYADTKKIENRDYTYRFGKSVIEFL